MRVYSCPECCEYIGSSHRAACSYHPANAKASQEIRGGDERMTDVFCRKCSMRTDTDVCRGCLKKEIAEQGAEIYALRAKVIRLKETLNTVLEVDYHEIPFIVNLALGET